MRSATLVAMIIAIFISASLLFAASPYGLGGTKTTTTTTRMTTTVTIFTASKTTQTTPATSSSNFADQMNSNGLEFMMSLSTPSLGPNGSLIVYLNLINTLGVNNTVHGYPTETNWLLTNQSEDGPINCAQNDPFRTEVLQGYYDLNNYSKGTPIDFTVWPPGGGPNYCLGFVTPLDNDSVFASTPLFTFYSNNEYIFSPMSDQARWIAVGLQGANQSATMGEEVHIKPSLFTNSTGVFTVLSCDQWGDLQALHFTIHD